MVVAGLFLLSDVPGMFRFCLTLVLGFGVSPSKESVYWRLI